MVTRLMIFDQPDTLAEHNPLPDHLASAQMPIQLDTSIGLVHRTGSHPVTQLRHSGHALPLIQQIIEPPRLPNEITV